MARVEDHRKQDLHCGLLSWHLVALFKAQLGEPFLGILILSPSFFSSCFRNDKSSANRKFSGHIPLGRPGVIRADVPGQKVRADPRNLGKNKHVGADVHDPNARTSMTPGGCKKLRAEKLRADLSFPIVHQKEATQRAVKGGGKLRGGGRKHSTNPSPKMVLDTPPMVHSPPPPFVHAYHCLRESGHTPDQSIPPQIARYDHQTPSLRQKLKPTSNPLFAETQTNFSFGEPAETGKLKPRTTTIVFWSWAGKRVFSHSLTLFLGKAGA